MNDIRNSANGGDSNIFSRRTNPNPSRPVNPEEIQRQEREEAILAQRAEEKRLEQAERLRKNRKRMDSLSQELEDPDSLKTHEPMKYHRENFTKLPDGRKAAYPVHKTSKMIHPDGGPYGPLPPLKPIPPQKVDVQHMPKNEAERRMLLCKKCPELLPLDRCKRCGCFMRIKTAIPGAQCPLQKW
jgi:hypothetical protein